jgi:tRNA-splicing ligase RtcB
LFRDGYTKSIEKTRCNAELVCFDINDHKEDKTSIAFFINRTENGRLINLRVESGESVRVTSDHPLLTPCGMKEAKDLKLGDEVGIFHFRGTEYEEPSPTVLLQDKDFPQPVVKELKKRKLLPLKLNHEKIGIIARLFGYILGDGWIYKVRERK